MVTLCGGQEGKSQNQSTFDVYVVVVQHSHWILLLVMCKLIRIVAHFLVLAFNPYCVPCLSSFNTEESVGL